MAVIQYFFAYYSRIILNSYTYRLFSKLFRHNPRIPIDESFMHNSVNFSVNVCDIVHKNDVLL